MIVSLIGMGVAAAASGVSAVMRHRAQKRIDRENNAAMQREAADQYNWYAKEYYQNPLNRSENQAILGYQKRQFKDAMDRNAATAKITGATPEAQMAVQQRYANAMADTASNIAAQESRRRDNLSAGWRNTLSNLHQRQNALRNSQMQQKMQNIDAFAQQAGSLAQAAANSFATSEPKTGKAATPSVSSELTQSAQGGVQMVKGKYPFGILSPILNFGSR